MVPYICTRLVGVKFCVMHHELAFRGHLVRSHLRQPVVSCLRSFDLTTVKRDCPDYTRWLRAFAPYLVRELTMPLAMEIETNPLVPSEELCFVWRIVQGHS